MDTVQNVLPAYEDFYMCEVRLQSSIYKVVASNVEHSRQREEPRSFFEVLSHLTWHATSADGTADIKQHRLCVKPMAVEEDDSVASHKFFGPSCVAVLPTMYTYSTNELPSSPKYVAIRYTAVYHSTI